MMNRILIIILLFLSFCSFSAISTQTETIVIMRHGEKPLGGLGQLTCQGLNRALALPRVLSAKFGKPDYIFAPDPHIQILDGVKNYYYVRPLATIEPTAIQFGMPVNAQFSYNDNKSISAALIANQYHNSLIYVAWEHFYAVIIAQDIIRLTGANNIIVPPWLDHDYDSLYVITIDWGKQPVNVTFVHDYEGLNNQSSACP